jgi:hypothetical protein
MSSIALNLVRAATKSLERLSLHLIGHEKVLITKSMLKYDRQSSELIVHGKKRKKPRYNIAAPYQVMIRSIHSR